MPISNTEIIYTLLINETLKRIKSICVNIDSFNPEIPDELKNGTKFRIANLYGLNGKYELYGTTLDSITKIVPASSVEDQFRTFLSSRNLSTKYSTFNLEEVSIKSLTHWYNNISAFITGRLKLINDSFGHGPFIFYDNSGNVTYQEINYVTEMPVDLDFNKTDIETAIKCLLNDVFNNANAYLLPTAIRFHYNPNMVTLTLNAIPSDANIVLTSEDPQYVQQGNNITVEQYTSVYYTVSKSGYLTESNRTLMGMTKTLNVKLRKYYTVIFTTNPSGAEVALTVNGISQVTDRVTVPEGTLIYYVVSKADCLTETGTITVTKDKTINIRLKQKEVTSYNTLNTFITYTVPEDVTNIQVDCVASKGYGDNGGKGGRVQCNLDVTPNEKLYLYIGGIPSNNNSVIYNAADIRTDNTGVTNTTSLQSRLIVAGAGGNQGIGGGVNAQGTGYAGGDGGSETGKTGAGQGGYGGSQTSGGSGGTGEAFGSNGKAGSFGLGGACVSGSGGSTGVGGAGWYGGGSGGSYVYAAGGIHQWWNAGGGGGGSSYINPDRCYEIQDKSLHTQGYNDGNGYITITDYRYK